MVILVEFVGQELVNMIMNCFNLRVMILLGITYSYISFFDKWNWYIMYVIQGNAPLTF